MYTALYRQWRPKAFSEVIGQKHVTTTLENALKQGRIAHAYLFAGPRGVGKTTVARILARSVNCKDGPTAEPCNDCRCCDSILRGASLDVIEVDAASNRGIDEIRELREKVRFYPAECRYKVYIIDEVHMLTSEAFNALLKTLEEPPDHAIFILATTEAHKIPLTILSRCQRFDFHRIEPEETVERLQEIIAAQNATADTDALMEIAQAADGSLRDALSVMDQALTLGEGNVTRDTVLSILGIPDRAAIHQTVLAIAGADVPALFMIVDEMLKSGRDLRQFARDLARRFRDVLLAASGATAGLRVTGSELTQIKEEARLFRPAFLIDVLKRLTQAESDMRWNSWPRLVLETCLLSLLPEPQPAATAATMAAAVAAPPPVKQKAQAQAPAQAQSAAAEPAAPVDLDAVKRAWPAILEMANKAEPRLRAFLLDGAPVEADGNAIVMLMKHSFHKEQLESRKDVLERVLSGYLRRPIQVRIELADDEKAKKKNPADDPLVRGVLSALGGEIIEDDERGS